jgi:phage terminase large subunit
LTEQAASPESRVLKGNELRAYIRSHPGWFPRRVLGQQPWPKQIDIRNQVFSGKHKHTEVSGCVGSTKTYALAMIALEWLYSFRPARVFSLAPSFRQVDANLWGYIRKLWNDAKVNGTPLGEDRDIFTVPKIQFHDRRTGKPVPGWYYEGFSTDEPHNVHGLHGENDLVIIDDAHGIKQALADEIENIMAGGNTRIVLAYNKMVLAGPTYNATHKEAAMWNHVGIAYKDLVAARKAGFKLDGALGAEAESRWKVKYGVNSNFYRVKVLNLHPKQEKDTLIPLDWIEAAFIRAERKQVLDTGPLVLGGDVARQGDDANCMAMARGRLIGPYEEWHEPDLMVTTGKYVEVMKHEENHMDGCAALSKAFAFIDSIGLGAGVIDRILEQNNAITGHKPGCRGCEENFKVEAVCGSEKAIGRVQDGGVWKEAEDVFKNLRSQIFWCLRESLNPANKDLIGLVRDDDLAAQLSCIRWRVGSDGLKEVEPKIGTSLNTDGGGTSVWGIKNRLGFSPDKADSVSYANWGLMRTFHGEVTTSDVEIKGGVVVQQSTEKFQVAGALNPHGVMDGGIAIGDGGLDGVE